MFLNSSIFYSLVFKLPSNSPMTRTFTSKSTASNTGGILTVGQPQLLQIKQYGQRTRRHCQYESPGRCKPSASVLRPSKYAMVLFLFETMCNCLYPRYILCFIITDLKYFLSSPQLSEMIPCLSQSVPSIYFTINWETSPTLDSSKCQMKFRLPSEIRKSVTHAHLVSAAPILFSSHRLKVYKW